VGKNKVVFVIDNFLPEVGGIQTILYNICNNFASDEIFVLTQPCKDDKKFDLEQKFKIIRKKFYLKTKNKYLFFLPLIWQILLLKLKYNIKYLHFANVLPSGRLGIFFKNKLKIDYCLYVFAMEVVAPLKKDKIAKKYLQNILNEAAQIFTISIFSKNIILKFGINTDKVVLINLGVDTSHFYPMSKDKKLVEKYQLDNKKVILIVGRLVKRKGFDKLIFAMPLILKEVPEAVCLIVGDGEEKSCLLNMVKTLKLEQSVLLVGSVDYSKINLYFNLADVFVMPSRELQEQGDMEGYGMVFIEANACKKSVIGGRSGGVSDAVIDGYNGLLVDPEDEQDIAKVISNILINTEMREKLAENGYKRVIQELTWQKCVETIRKSVK
jgi:phosphatidyl-myo-inositol dimannoside synthase